MANDLATLTTQLTEALRDGSHATWTLTEKQTLIQNSVASLYPHTMKYVTMPVQVEQGASFITVGDASYPFASIHRIDLWDYDPTSPVGRMVMELPGRVWEVQEDITPGTGFRVAINPHFNYNAAHYLLVHGYVPYNTTTQLVPDHLVPLVLAQARAEAYRRMGGDRAQFENWLVSNQKQDVSVNELLQMIREAQNEADALMYRAAGRSKKPVVARR